MMQWVVLDLILHSLIGVSEETDEAIYSELVVGKATSAVALSSQFTTNNIGNLC